LILLIWWSPWQDEMLSCPCLSWAGVNALVSRKYRTPTRMLSLIWTFLSCIYWVKIDHEIMQFCRKARYRLLHLLWLNQAGPRARDGDEQNWIQLSKSETGTPARSLARYAKHVLVFSLAQVLSMAWCNFAKLPTWLPVPPPRIGGHVTVGFRIGWLPNFRIRLTGHISTRQDTLTSESD